MDVIVNGEPQDLPTKLTIAELLEHLALAEPRGVAVAVNDAVVPRGRHAHAVLASGDRVEIVRAVQGG